MTRARMAATVAMAALIPALLAGASQGRDIHVPQDAPTLKLALAEAAAGDRIILSAGRYLESGLSLPDSITILGDAADPGAVVLDGQGQNTVLRAEWTHGVLIRGLTVTGGMAAGDDSFESSGGALIVYHASIRIDRVHFRANQARTSGGAVRVCRGALEAVDCLFEDNHALKGGGAIDLSFDAEIRFDRVRFLGNSAAWGGALSIRYSSTCLLAECELADNTTIAPQEAGGAIFSDRGSAVTLDRCLLVRNSAHHGGAARLNSVQAAFTSCTVAANRALEAGGAFIVAGTALEIHRSIIGFNEGAALDGQPASLACRASNIHGNLGGDWTGDLEALRHQSGNMESDPLFCDSGDFRLQDESPCAPDNNPAGLIGAMPVGCESIGLTLYSFTATQDRRQVTLAWHTTPGAFEFRLQGFDLADTSSSPWNVAYAAGQEPGRYLASDTPPADAGSLVYRLAALHPDGGWQPIGEASIQLEAVVPDLPLSLDSVYPNPFNPRVNILYTLARRATVRAAIYDLNGRLVDSIVSWKQEPGTHRMTWDGQDQTGRSAPAGMYLLRLEGSGVRHTAKLMLVK